MKRLIGVAVFLLVCVAGLQAGIDYSFYCITSMGSDAQIGVDQLSVNVSDAGIVQYEGQDRESVTFKFTNSGPDASVISEIYFDDGTLLAQHSIVNSDGVSFYGNGDGGKAVSPSNLPAGNTLDPAFIATAAFSSEANNPEPKNGVGPGEWVEITFVLKENKTYDDIIAELDDGLDLRIGLHVKAFDSGSSQSFVNASDTVGGNIPEPATMALLGIGGLLLRKRR